MSKEVKIPQNILKMPSKLNLSSILTSDFYVLEVDVPGADPKTLKVYFQDQDRKTLIVSGERNKNVFGAHVHLDKELEIYDFDKLEASTRNGVLTVVVPAKPKKKSKLNDFTIVHYDEKDEVFS